VNKDTSLDREDYEPYKIDPSSATGISLDHNKPLQAFHLIVWGFEKKKSAFARAKANQSL